MNNNSKKILIVSYSLPPYGGIGGRRWTKFGIALIERGYDVQYLTPKKNPVTKKRWEDDFKKIKNRIHYFQSNYPSVLQKFRLNFLEKIAYRFYLYRLKNRVKGNYFDPSCLDENVLIKNVVEFIDQGFLTVISTGAPFDQLYFLSLLRQKRNDFKLFVDLRDPWTMQDWSYGFPSLSDNRKKVEKEREAFVMRTADKVITVLPRMTKDLAVYGDSQKFFTIYNGFDLNDVSVVTETIKSEPKINFIFAGNFYDSALHHIQQLTDAISRLRSENSQIPDQINFNFYGRAPKKFHEIVSAEPSINHHGFIPSYDVGMKVANSDIGLLFLIDGFNYSLSTKFFEYIAQSKPVLLFAKPGETSNYILEHGIGWHFEKKNTSKIFRNIIEKKGENNLKLESAFDRNQFSIRSLTDKLELVLKETEPKIIHQ